MYPIYLDVNLNHWSMYFIIELSVHQNVFRTQMFILLHLFKLMVNTLEKKISSLTFQRLDIAIVDFT
jgi:hypothetical protein